MFKNYTDLVQSSDTGGFIALYLSFLFFYFTGIKHGRSILLGYCADQILVKGYIFPAWFESCPSNSNPFPELPQLGAQLH